MSAEGADPVGGLYDELGEERLTLLVRAFYAQVPQDDVLGPMYPAQDMEGAEERLFDFLVYRFGGPQRYLEVRGHPRLRRRHAPFPVGLEARDRWIACMTVAIQEAQLPAGAGRALLRFFGETATFLINRPGGR